MASDAGYEQTNEVTICGCGPTGAMLSAYLGKLGVPNIVLEKEAAITTDPRGIALDEDGIRIVQGLGLYKDIFADTGCCMERVRFIGGVHNDLQAKPFLSVNTAVPGNTGHVYMMFHKQPFLEKHLRSVAKQSNTSQLRDSCTVTGIHEDDEWVYTTYADAGGSRRVIRSRFLVAADGKTGFTRKNYLEPKGIRLEWAERSKYEETWVAMNWKLHLPTKETHPSFPLWGLGYTPEGVYDLFFPAEFRFLCNPNRSAVCGRFGLPEDRLWRFEFVIAPGEDGTEMAQPHKVREVVYPYLRHPGSRYGLTEDVQYPEDCIEVLRSRPFRFSARSCNKWALGRVILCGDAAHVFPPFGGQGIASGFRDAVALAWRLAIACSSQNSVDYGSLLTGWYEERKQQLDKSLQATVTNGDKVNSKDPLRIFLRDWTLWGVQLIPALKRQLELGPRAEGPVRYTHKQGMPFVPELDGGYCFPQTYCVSLGEDSKVQFTDDVIFKDGKKKIFQLVVLLNNLDELRTATKDITHAGEISGNLSYDEATFFIPRSSLPTPLDEVQTHGLTDKLFRTATDTEFAQSNLCVGRPPPREYNETLLWDSTGRKRYFILRLDRFVFAACSTLAELSHAAAKLDKLLGASRAHKL